MVKEIFICQDGIIIRYHKKKYITHPFYRPHNGTMIDVSIEKDILMKEKLFKLKEECKENGRKT